MLNYTNSINNLTLVEIFTEIKIIMQWIKKTNQN